MGDARANRQTGNSTRVQVEPLEHRVLLALVPHDIDVTIFRDMNRNRARDAGEALIAGWPVKIQARNAAGTFNTVQRVTDANGKLRFVAYGDRNFSIANVRPEPSTRYWFTTSDGRSILFDAEPGGHTSAEFGVTNIGPVRGTVRNAFSLDGKKTDYTDLFGRRVFEDLNANGRFDKREPSTLTDFSGAYQLMLKAGPHTLRVEPMPGWRTAAGERTSKSIDLNSKVIDGPDFLVSMSKPAVIDVATVHTTAAAAGRGATAMVERVRWLFVQANRVHANSNTNVLLRPVRIAPTTYTESSEIETDLSRLQRARDGHLDDALTLRDRYRADLVVLFAGKRAYADGTLGLAYLPDGRGSDANRGFSVVSLQQDNTTDWVTFTHETAHNLGAGHDKPNADGDPVRPYAYGHVRKSSGWRDVMSYGSEHVLAVFSNSQFSFEDEPLGDARSQDNARVIREIGPTVSGYRR